MVIRRTWTVYVLLLAIWAILLGWQVAEHSRVLTSSRATLINRAKDISNTLGLVVRSQRRFGGVISRERMESILNELIRPGELEGIALANTAGEIIATAGNIPDLHATAPLHTGQLWTDRIVTLINLVELGTNVTQDLERSNPTIVIPRHELFGSETNRPPQPPPEFRSASDANSRTGMVSQAESRTNRTRSRGPRDGRSGFGRPPWMNEEQFKTIIAKQGVRSFIIVMSTEPFLAAVRQDLLMRGMLTGFASIAVLGFGLAWRNLGKSSELQIRLLRASELNSHLKEMNLAAAGLAHETRNPLNIVRGLAQMISKQQDASVEIRKRSREIVDETDRVTAQLNEFINYSRPREVRRAPLQLEPLIAEVVRALAYDVEEKKISVQVNAQSLTIEADEPLLRQALFNLVLNAVQAAESEGRIEVRVQRTDDGALLEVCDNGPGVLPEHRNEIFKPYFTTNPAGTGLGLAVVKQIVLAHGWEIQCLANEPRGAIFRISHLKVVSS
jgi:signal transduction histidine kinase